MNLQTNAFHVFRGMVAEDERKRSRTCTLTGREKIQVREENNRKKSEDTEDKKKWLLDLCVCV